MSVSWRRTAPYAFAQQRIGKERYTVDESGWLPLQPIQGCPVPTNAAGNEVRRSFQSIDYQCADAERGPRIQIPSVYQKR